LPADRTQSSLVQLLARPIAHRGLHACGASGPVENSIGAAEAAVAAGFGIECDVRLSQDGEVMVFHDDRLDRLTDATGYLADVDAAALARLRLRGTRDQVPTLAALLATVDGRVPLVIEMKSMADRNAELAARTLALIETYPGPVAVESFDTDLVAYCLDHRPLHVCVGLVGPAESGPDAAPALLSACDFVSWSIADLARFVEGHAACLRTTWTIRTKADLELARKCDAQIVFEGASVEQLLRAERNVNANDK
jgi:glycerophosphoryl diester phosphodiesterase